MTIASLDPTDALPPEARDKLLGLRQQTRDAHVLLMALIDEREGVRVERQQIEGHIRRMTMPVDAGGFGLQPDDPRVEAEQVRADKLGTEVARLNALHDARGARWQDMKRLVTVLDTWVSRLGPSTLELHTGPAPKLARGEKVGDAVERCRRRQRELRADLARVEAAPVPSSMAKEKARVEVEALATRGRPNVVALIDGAGEIGWPLARAEVSMWREGRPDPNAPLVRAIDPAALVAWMARDELLAALEAEIDELADDDNALTDTQRTAKRAEIEADLLATERDEEAFILQAAASGTEILRRGDADPRAVLGLIHRTSS